MTARVLTFTLVDLLDGRGLGVALIGLEARYASIAWRRAERLERRHAMPKMWQGIEQQVALGLEPGPLPVTSAMVECLLDATRRRSVTVHYRATRPLAIEPTTAAEQLDAELLQSAR